MVGAEVLQGGGDHGPQVVGLERRHLSELVRPWTCTEVMAFDLRRGEGHDPVEVRASICAVFQERMPMVSIATRSGCLQRCHLGRG